MGLVNKQGPVRQEPGCRITSVPLRPCPAAGSLWMAPSPRAPAVTGSVQSTPGMGLCTCSSFFLLRLC
ncbi:hypothetical protein ACRRTK_016998 [Alexandromys fortis]